MTVEEKRVALAHDWLAGMRGGERVLEALCGIYPKARIYTLVHNPAAISPAINSHLIQTSCLRYLPNSHRHYRIFLPVLPLIIESMRVRDADLLISSSHCVAKGIKSSPETTHVCYCFTPMRYAWTFYEEYFGRGAFKGVLAKPMLAALRAWDRKSSARVDRFIAISRHIQDRIKRFYGRDSDIVYPPVDVEKWTPGARRDGGFDLVVSAMVPYKRVDLAIRAYSRSGFPLKVVGIGSGLEQLCRLAAPNVEFLGQRTDEEILELYRNARLLVFPGEEDFGIVPLEAQACGCPVVAYGKGGALETVMADSTGVFFDRQDEDALLAAVEEASRRRWLTADLRENAERFSIPRFIEGLTAAVNAARDGKKLQQSPKEG